MERGAGMGREGAGERGGELKVEEGDGSSKGRCVRGKSRRRRVEEKKRRKGVR